jgi:hypothetical protein
MVLDDFFSNSSLKNENARYSSVELNPRNILSDNNFNLINTCIINNDLLILDIVFKYFEVLSIFYLIGGGKVIAIFD